MQGERATTLVLAIAATMVASIAGSASGTMRTGQEFSRAGTAPETAVTERPKRKITTTKRKVKVRVSFATEEDQRTSYLCKLDRASYEFCASPYKTKAKSKRGKGKKHTISIRSVDDSTGDLGRPARVKFRVIRKG